MMSNVAATLAAVACGTPTGPRDLQSHRVQQVAMAPLAPVPACVAAVRGAGREKRRRA
jgi:hypothetical protein